MHVAPYYNILLGILNIFFSAWLYFYRLGEMACWSPDSEFGLAALGVIFGII